MTGSDYCELMWRTGRKLGRSIYAMVDDTPSDDDIFIGVMDTVELAEEVVIAHNCTRNGFWPDG